MIAVNEYFDGDVKSLSFNTSKLPATVGVMLPGEYTFNTDAQEKVTVIAGEMNIRLPGSDNFTCYRAGQSFDVPAQSAFDIRLDAEVAYLCLYGQSG